MSRFDYVKYDELATKQQATFKELFTQIDDAVVGFDKSRAQALAYTKLEEAYMWIGKAIRDGQITRNGSAELQEGRGNE